MKYLPAPTHKPLRVYSDGAGTQSVAVMVLQSMGLLHYDAYVFANVGEKSENPDTIAYRNEVMLPFAEKHEINVIERRRIYKGEPIDLYDFTLAPGTTIPIPVKFSEGGMLNRKCTSDWKVEVVNKWIKQEAKAPRVILGIGFSSDERGRIYKKYKPWHDRNYSWEKKKNQTGQWKPGAKLGFWRQYEFPLAAMGINRAAGIALVQNAGLPAPPASKCWFCPFTSRQEWIERKMTDAPAFAQAEAFEEALNAKYKQMKTAIGGSLSVSLHRDGIALKNVPAQLSLFDTFEDAIEPCDVGYCGL